jgi:thymidine kinase
MAELKFYYGCMNAGKSVEAIKTYEIYKRKNMNPVIIKPVIDNREGEQKGWGYTSSRLTKEPTPAYYIKSVEEDIWKTNYGQVIIVDEAQFLTRDDVVFLSKIVELQKVDVIAYGLKNDVNGNLFSGAKAFMEFADTIKEIDMICEEPGCKNKATHHLRYINGKPDASNEQVAIEKGNVTYKSVCRKHWMQKKNIIYGY